MKLCLISSNIRFDNPSDGVNAWPHRRYLLKETLLKHSPDIIATQEGRFNQLKDFEELLEDFEIVDNHRSWIKERMYPTFFIRKKAFELIKSEDLWLSETPDIAGSKSFDSAFPRLMTWMKLQPSNSDLNFLVINTHLDHIKQETRKSQIQVLAQEIKRVWDRNSYLLITGDFNDSPDSEVRKHLEIEFPELIDSWKLFHTEEETSHHTFNGICDGGSRIDWILVDERVQIKNSILDKNTIGGKYPSDHFPVVCSIEV
jgi:endonuclease/exonuclease/phosphatase family metal-dependent hydrolase